MEDGKVDWEKIFAVELSQITNDFLRYAVIKILNTEVLDRHAHEGASSTGKYHPAFSQGDGGLIRHTKAVVFLTAALCDTRPGIDRDSLIAAAILHDMCKYNASSDYTLHEHPAIMAGVCMNHNLPAVATLIESHMGQWCSNKRSSIVLPMPSNEDEWLLHQADYLASRTRLKLTFDEEWNIVQQ